ncbi:hypothetical protein NUW58_g8164 [Xylaria curta]|uniref:Uncharacterized protein n=1 Tax=Xylaria curta TaxID=42375 RepID=A0ACC1NBB6_9PEZI|nr:hypothetical protein NUW58_g8164 [Xylaria curta]
MDPELMAPPLSSDSSESDEEIWPPLKSIPKARTRQPASVLRQTPDQNDDISDISSPPSLTHSPNYAHSSSPPPTRAVKPKRKAAPKPPRKVTTADLTGLLPRRRRRAIEDAFGIDEDDSEPEVDISGLGDDDELAHLDVRTRRRPASRVNNTRNQVATKTRAPTRNKDKPTQSSNKRISRTYGRLSDKENHDQDEDEANDGSNSLADLGEDDSQVLVERMGEELKTARRKFQERTLYRSTHLLDVVEGGFLGGILPRDDLGDEVDVDPRIAYAADDVIEAHVQPAQEQHALVVPADWQERSKRGEVVAEAFREWEMKEHSGYARSVYTMFKDGGVYGCEKYFREFAQLPLKKIAVLGEADDVCDKSVLADLGFDNVEVVPQTDHAVVRTAPGEVARIVYGMWTQ